MSNTRQALHTQAHYKNSSKNNVKKANVGQYRSFSTLKGKVAELQKVWVLDDVAIMEETED